jgi:PAS domain S-box-containing protein
MRFSVAGMRAVRLYTKLMLALALLVATMVGGSAYVMIERQRDRQLQELEDRATQFADLLSASLAQPLWNVDLNAVNRQLAALARDSAIVELSVVDVKYGPLATATGPQAASSAGRIVRERPIEYAAFEGQPIERIGAVRVVLNRAVADQAIGDFRRAILVIAAATLAGLYAVTFLLLKRLVGGPVNRLEEMVDRIAGGDLDARCAVESGDELGHLATRVNAMADRLRESTAQLSESERKYHGIFEAVGVAILEQDFSQVKADIDRLRDQGIGDFKGYLTEHPDFGRQAMSNVRVVDANSAAVRLFGAKNKQDLLASFPKTLGPEMTSTVAKALEAVGALGEGSALFEAETTLRTLNGEPLTALFTVAFPPRSERFDRVLVTVTDITERKKWEEDLRRSEAYLAAAESLSKSGSWAWKLSTGEITYWSQERYRVFGFDPEEGIPSLEAVLKRIHPDDRAKWLDAVSNVTRDLERLDFDFRIVLPNGELRVLHGISHPIFNESGDFVEIIGAAMDITERRRAEEALRETQTQLAHANRVASIGQLTASIAHEVNQPIGATVANAQAALRWLDRPTPELDEAKQALGRIVRDGARAGAVVDGIRRLIRRTPLRGDLVDINAAVSEVIVLARSEAAKNDVSVRMDLAEGLPLVQGDRVEFQQVILNLTINAVEAMSGVEGERELLIRTGKNEAGEIVVSVSDSGPGVAPATIEHLFKAFFTTKANGLGLGLSICRSIVEAHGGRLWASANAPCGAVFQFTLPSQLGVGKPKAATAHPGKVPAAKNPGSGVPVSR